MVKTQDQINALDLMQKWNSQNEDLFCTVNGAAGTGKTTITIDFIRTLGLLPSKVAVSAPTHKAKKVIQKVTKYTGTTIQKLLGLRPNTDIEKFDINRPQFDPLGRDEIQYYKIIILDESSMINASLYALLKKKANRYGVKVLFLGDEYQLPPVGENISKVFSDVKYKATLTTVVRQGKDNPMSIALLKLRKDVKNGTEEGIKYLTELKENVLNEKGFKCLPRKQDETFGNGETFGNQTLQYYFSTEYKHNKDYIKFLAFTNDSVEKWSSAFRHKILGEDAKNVINEGESLLGYNSIINGRTNNLILENSEEYNTVGVTEGESPLGIPGFYVDLENEESGSRRVFIVNPEDITLFKQICIEKLDAAKAYGRGYWTTFYNFKNTHLLMHNVYKDDSKPRNYRNLLCKKDIYYNYGVTVHKSQGSTYDNIAVNLPNIYNIRDVYLRNRLLYVALSRAKNMNLILVK